MPQSHHRGLFASRGGTRGIVPPYMAKQRRQTSNASGGGNWRTGTPRTVGIRTSCGTRRDNGENEFGLEAAQIVLGHAPADVTQVSADRDLAKAVEVARKVG